MSNGNTNNTVFIQKLFTSRDNFVDGNVQQATANTANYVGQEGRIWWNPDLNAFYYSDGNTPGGFLINGPVGNGQPGGPVNSVQINNGDGNFYGSANFIFDGSNANLAGNVNASYFIGNGSQLTDINTNKIFNDTSYANIENPNGNLEVNINSYSWIFDSTGNLTVPANSTISPLSDDLTLDAGGNVYIKSKGHVFLFDSDTVGRLIMPPSGIIAVDDAVGNGLNLFVGNTSTEVGNTWNFGVAGNLTLPDGSIVSNGFISGAPGSAGGVTNGGTGYQQFYAQDDGVYVQTSVGNAGTVFNTWQFGLDGNLTTPGTILLTGVTDAHISSSSNINIISNGNIWDFGTDGNLTLPGNSEISINYANGYPYGVTNITGLAAGNTTEVQFNLDGNFSASANFTYDDTTQELTVLGNAQFNNANLGNLATANNFSTNGSGGDITLTGGNITGANVIDANTLVGTTAGNLYVTGNILPSSGVYNLGLASAPWANAYFGPQSVTLLDSTGNLANSVTIENLAANITMGTAGFNIVKLGTADSIFRIESLTGRIFSNALTVISNDTNSANTTSGSLQTAGGAGIVKDLYVGGNIYGEGSTISNVVTYVTTGVGLSGGGTGNVGIDATGVQSITGTANRIIVTDLGGQNFNISAPQDLNTSSTLTFANLTITGNLTVNGTTTTANSANLDSKVLYLAANSTSNSQIDQGGIVLGNNSSSYKVSILYDLPNNAWNTDGANLTTLDFKAANVNIDFLNVQNGGHFGLLNEALDYPNAYIQVDSNLNSYSQIVSQNHSPGTSASSDLVLVNDIGDDGNHYIDMGINGSNYVDPAFSSTLANDGYLFINQGNLVIGTDTAAKTIKFVAGGTTINDIVLTISNTGLVTPGNSQANYFIGNGSSLTSITGANVTGTVANATYAISAGSVTNSLTVNNSGIGSASGATFNGSSAVTISYNTVGAPKTDGTNATGTWGISITGNSNVANTANSVAGANVTGAVAFATTANAVAGANVSGTVANATYAVTAGTANSVAGANVTGAVAFATTANSVAGANVSGTVANATYAVTAGTANSVAGANVSGQVANALIAGTVYTNAQPNITSVGTLTGLTSNGVINFTNTSNVTLGAVANLHISGGTSNYVMKTDGTGNLAWIDVNSISNDAPYGDQLVFVNNANVTLTGTANTTQSLFGLTNGVTLSSNTRYIYRIVATLAKTGNQDANLNYSLALGVGTVLAQHAYNVQSNENNTRTGISAGITMMSNNLTTGFNTPVTVSTTSTDTTAFIPIIFEGVIDVTTGGTVNFMITNSKVLTTFTLLALAEITLTPVSAVAANTTVGTWS
jgi:hypothetical protein